jgi:hypothetical protein
MKLSPDLFRELARAFGITVCDRKEMYRRMLRCERRAQCADATRSNNRYTQLFALQNFSLASTVSIDARARILDHFRPFYNF